MSRAAGALLLLAVALAGPAVAARGVVTEETVFQEVVVRPGDTLWGIANKYLKDPASWDQILKHNRLPSRDPTVALPGMTLKVPVRLIKTSLRAAHLVYAVNRVLFRRKDTAEWKSSKMQMELFQGDTLRTLADSKARVKFLNKELLSLEPDSMAIIKPVESAGDVELRAGSVFAGRARVVTASALVTPRTADTRYAASVTPDLTTKVEVYKGLAAVDAQGRTVEVPEGMATQVRPGLAPELPKKIVDWPVLEARALEYDSSAVVGGGAAPAPRGPALAAPEAEADAESLRGDLSSLRVGLPILAYRVQAAKDRDFASLVLDKRYDAEDRFRPEQEGLVAGAYWWRVAVIDLLGTEGRFSEPRYYTVGIKRARAATVVDLKKAVTIVAPAEDETVYDDKVRVIGVLRDDRLRAAVNGKLVRVDADGNFVAEVSLSAGKNEIVITIDDTKGNEVRISRRVTRQ
ncbi:MAG: LysM peptidoglycan-binding domain-containing protein [Elusimicrobiota bacterium]|nr:LysM peptidoglycan-binding domain-containing protein [Elusimicrobiota bacterium]